MSNQKSLTEKLLGIIEEINISNGTNSVELAVTVKTNLESKKNKPNQEKRPYLGFGTDSDNETHIYSGDM